MLSSSESNRGAFIIVVLQRGHAVQQFVLVLPQTPAPFRLLLIPLVKPI